MALIDADHLRECCGAVAEDREIFSHTLPEKAEQHTLGQRHRFGRVELSCGQCGGDAAVGDAMGLGGLIQQQRQC